MTGWPYCPPPRSSRTLSFALASGHDSTVLIPPAKDSGESPSFTVGLTPCYCGVLGGLHVLVGSLTSPSQGRLFEPSSLGRLLCLRLGCRTVPSSRFLNSVYYLACSLTAVPMASCDRHSVALALSSSL